MNRSEIVGLIWNQWKNFQVQGKMDAGKKCWIILEASREKLSENLRKSWINVNGKILMKSGSEQNSLKIIPLISKIWRFINIIFLKFNYKLTLYYLVISGSFHWKSNNSKTLQYSSTLVSILVNFRNNNYTFTQSFRTNRIKRCK